MIDRSEMEKRFYVSSFDGLRAIGILSIIIYHLYSYRLPGGSLVTLNGASSSSNP